MSKGIEYLRSRETLVVRAGAELSRTIRLRRWINMPARGWYSGDDHIHVRRSPRENPLLADWLAARSAHGASSGSRTITSRSIAFSTRCTPSAG